MMQRKPGFSQNAGNPTIDLTIANAAASNEAVIYIGTPNVLNLTLANATGGNITMQSAAGNVSSLVIYMPRYFTAAEVQAMSKAVTGISPAVWKPEYDSNAHTITLTYTETTGSWAANTNITFTISNVVSNAAATMGPVQVNFNNLNGQNVPGQARQNLALNAPVNTKSPNLTDVLNVNLDDQGSVFVSAQSDPLSNTLYLNFKNTGTKPLCTGPWKGNPVVKVSFIYGNTVGALAPDDYSTQPAPGSAWLISVSTDVSESWGFQNPVDTDDNTPPVWMLFPNSNNQDIIGTCSKANVTFAFNNITSFTPAGHTQMYVQFINFPATSTTQYNTALFVLDIVKQAPPATRGLTGFFSTAGAIIPLTQPAQNIRIPLKWNMYYVDNINLICNVPGVKMVTRNYFRKDQTPNIPALNYDTCLLDIPFEVAQDTPVFITIQAFDNNGSYLNSLQFTVFISVNFFVDPGGNTYPTIFINNQTWLDANFKFNAGAGSVAYNKDANNVQQYGMLYTYEEAHENIPTGWRIPTQADWQGLITAAGSTAYMALLKDGPSGFNAQLGGYCDDEENFNSLALNGHYWTSTPDGNNAGNNLMAAFYSGKTTVNVLGSFPVHYFLSVRYVKNS